MHRRQFLLNAIGLAASLAQTFPVAAKTGWPAKPLRIVVPVAPGGSLDILARVVAQGLGPRLQQTVIVENMPGAGGNIAFGHVAKAPPDGYTLLLGWDSLIINPSLYPSVPYTLEQFAPITLAITSPQVLLVGSKLPVKNVKELVNAAKKAPDGLTLGNAGNGSPGHLAAGLLQTHTGTKFIHVPYKGGAPAVADLLAGHLDALIVTLPAALQHIRTGKLTALAVTSAKRSTGAPEIPTMDEAGITGYELNSWQGFFAPAGTSEELITRINSAIVEVLRDRPVQDQLVDQGFEVTASTPDTLAKEIAKLAPRWSRLVRETGAKVD
jgi:tripartite-type tricarboxylate transporter receptor subunit TctC